MAAAATAGTAAPARIIGATANFLGALVEQTKDNTIGVQQVLLLMALYVHAGPGGLNQVDLPRFTGVERSANSRNIARMGSGQWTLNRATGTKSHDAGMGLVEAYEEPTNRRFKMVRLTPKGRAVLEAAAAQVAPYFEAR